jgi:murein DD-endopeptidase MepM/ murein hydrolase activator NlpD
LIRRIIGPGSWPRRLAGPALAAALLSAPFSADPHQVAARSAPAAAYALVSTSGIVVGALGNTASTDSAPDGRLGFGAPTAANSVGTVAVAIANLRAGPGTTFTRIDRLRAGTVVTLLEQSTDWFRVQTPGGGVGWIAQELLSVDPTTASGVVTAKSVPAKPGMATIRNVGVNLRSGPSTQHRVLGKLSQGTNVEVLGSEASWSQIKTTRGTTGWVRSDFLSASGGATPAIFAPAAVAANEMVGTVNGNRTNLRQGPGTAFPSLSKLGAKTRLTLVARHGDWYKVQTANGTSGWVLSELLSVNPAVARSVAVTNDVPAAPEAAPAAASTSWVWPTRGVLTSRFGWRYLLGRNFHNGIDIANRKWTPIVAARAGTVKQAGWCGGYGYCVIINHGDGFVTEYGHLADAPPVRAGRVVGAGQLIGHMGMTYDRRYGGYATGVHLHFTIRRNGQAVNPLAYLK